MNNFKYKHGFNTESINHIYNLLITLSQNQSYENKEEGLKFLETIYSKDKIAMWTEDFIITVWDSEQFVGFGRAKQNGWVTHLYINTPYQCKGIGSEILQGLEQILITKGHKILYLNSEPAELIFYKKRGYITKQDEIHNYHGILIIPMEKHVD